MYGIDLSVQFENLMPALGLGFILAFVYDVFQFLKMLVSRGKVFVFIADMIYVVLCTLASFLLFVAVNSGHIRGYLILAEVLAAAVYRFTAGIPVSFFFSKVAYISRMVVLKFFSPFEYVWGKMSVGFKKIINFFQKRLKIRK